MKNILFLVLSFGFIQAVQAQSGGNVLSPNYGNGGIYSNRWTYGGNIGVGGNFGSNNSAFNISVSPRVGYMLTQNLNLGISAGYNYQSSRYYSTHIIGVGPELNYYINNLYLGTEFQYNFISGKSKNETVSSYNHQENALYIGGGYVQQIGNNTHLQVGLKYNVLYNKDKSIFASGFVPSVGIIVGI